MGCLQPSLSALPVALSRVRRPHLAGGVEPCPICQNDMIPRNEVTICPTCGRPARYVYSFGDGRGGEPEQRVICPVCDPVAA